MKNLSFLLLMPFMLLFASCDQCEKTDCGPNGNCSQGECFCDTGYYGDNCENGYIDQILDKGNWLSNLYVDNADEEFLDAYGTSVQADASNPLKFYIPGFYQYEGNNISMSGIVQDNWNVTFPAYTDPNTNITITGTGKIYQTPTGFLMEIFFSVDEPLIYREFRIVMYPS